MTEQKWAQRKVYFSRPSSTLKEPSCHILPSDLNLYVINILTVFLPQHAINQLPGRLRQFYSPNLKDVHHYTFSLVWTDRPLTLEEILVDHFQIQWLASFKFNWVTQVTYCNLYSSVVVRRQSYVNYLHFKLLENNKDNC